MSRFPFLYKFSLETGATHLVPLVLSAWKGLHYLQSLTSRVLSSAENLHSLFITAAGPHRAPFPSTPVRVTLRRCRRDSTLVSVSEPVAKLVSFYINSLKSQNLLTTLRTHCACLETPLWPLLCWIRNPSMNKKDKVSFLRQNRFRTLEFETCIRPLLWFNILFLSSFFLKCFTSEKNIYPVITGYSFLYMSIGKS